MTVSGNLAFQSRRAVYGRQIDSASSTFANVTGTAALGRHRRGAFAPGSYVTKQPYMILTRRRRQRRL